MDAVSTSRPNAPSPCTTIRRIALRFSIIAVNPARRKEYSERNKDCSERNRRAVKRIQGRKFLAWRQRPVLCWAASIRVATPETRP